MSTRSVIVITGFNERPPGRETIRLYKHWDGYPTDNLRLIRQGIQRAKQFIDDHQLELHRYTPSGLMPMITEVPVKTFADMLIAESITWHGAVARLDTDWTTNTLMPRCGDPEFRLAHYPGDVNVSSFGRQGDLEWVYLVDLPRQAITVWATDGKPDACFGSPATDPRVYASCLIPEARHDERAQISQRLEDILSLGWTVTKAGSLTPSAQRKSPSLPLPCTGVRHAQ